MSSSSPSPGVITAAASFGLVALTIYLLVVGESIIMPFVLAIFITYLIVALGHRIQRLKIGRRHPPGWLGITTAIGILLLAIALTVQIAAGNIAEVVQGVPLYQQRLQEMFNQGMAFAARVLKLKEVPTFSALVAEVDFGIWIERFAPAFRVIAQELIQVFIYVGFLLLELRTFDVKLKAIFPDPSRQEKLRATLKAMGRKIEHYVLIKTGICALNATLSYIILSMFGVDFAGFWALLTFVLNYIPYIGSPMSTLFPTVLTLLQFGDPFVMALVMGSLVLAHTFVENVIEPHVTGKSLNLSPVVMILSLSTWGAIWGITGMILSVPLMVIGTIVLAQFPKTRPIAVMMSANGDVS